MQYCCFPHLVTLVISDCPKLNVKPYFPASLQSLTLEGSNEHQFSSLCFSHPRHAGLAYGDEPSSSSCIVDVKHPHLTELKLGRLIGSLSGCDVLQHLAGLHVLEISKCRDISHLPESMKCLTCLRRLVIEYCGNLCVLPEWLGELQSLQVLHIRGLPVMSFIPPQAIQHLTSLEDLIIRECNALQQLPEQLGKLCSLRTLGILYLPALTHLPESMRHLTSLQHLDLCRCKSLRHLPESLGELSALRSLYIQSCPGLASLPRSIQCLSALEVLLISYNPELLRRCREGVGEDWHLVSHVPKLRLRD